MRRFASTLLAVVLVGTLAALPRPEARSEETESEPEEETEEATEPPLEGEAKERHDREVKELLDFLLDRKNQGLLEERIRDVGARRSRAARDALIEFCIGRKSKRYLLYAFEEIGRIGGPVAVDFLCGKDALRSGDVLVQKFAAEALASTKDRRAMDDLLEVLGDRRTKIEAMAAAALAVAQVAPADEKVTETLLELAAHRRDETRAGAVEALGYLRTETPRRRLEEALRADRNANVRAAAARGLAHTADAAAIPVLEAAIGDEKSNEVREACQEAITRLRGG